MIFSTSCRDVMDNSPLQQIVTSTGITYGIGKDAESTAVIIDQNGSVVIDDAASFEFSNKDLLGVHNYVEYKSFGVRTAFFKTKHTANSDGSYTIRFGVQEDITKSYSFFGVKASFLEECKLNLNKL